MEKRAGPEDVLLRCMAAVAGADGRVDDTELEEISGIYREMTGREAPLDRLRAEVEAGWAVGGAGAVDFVTRAASEADLETRLSIAEACYRVLAADGEITGREAGTFNGVVGGLGLSTKDVLRRLER